MDLQASSLPPALEGSTASQAQPSRARPASDPSNPPQHASQNPAPGQPNTSAANNAALYQWMQHQLALQAAAQIPLQPFTPAAFNNGGGTNNMWRPARGMNNMTQGMKQSPQDATARSNEVGNCPIHHVLLVSCCSSRMILFNIIEQID